MDRHLLACDAARKDTTDGDESATRSTSSAGLEAGRRQAAPGATRAGLGDRNLGEIGCAAGTYFGFGYMEAERREIGHAGSLYVDRSRLRIDCT